MGAMILLVRVGSYEAHIERLPLVSINGVINCVINFFTSPLRLKAQI